MVTNNIITEWIMEESKYISLKYFFPYFYILYHSLIYINNMVETFIIQKLWKFTACLIILI